MSSRDRAVRLARFYPRPWRLRYGDEFVELLVDDIEERRLSPRRFVDVAWHGAGARLSDTGLVGEAPALRRIRANLGLFAAALIVFLTIGVADWSSLSVQTASPGGVSEAALSLMSAALYALVPLCLLAAAPIVWAIRSRGRALLEALAGPVVLVAGSVYIGTLRWPGSSHVWWAAHGLVPIPVVETIWASTCWITTYWFHPASLFAFRADLLAWMVVGPVALAATVAGAARAVAHAHSSPRSLRALTLVAGAAALTMAVFLAGALIWVCSGASGVIDVAGLIVMAAALAIGAGAARRSVEAGSGLAR